MTIFLNTVQHFVLKSLCGYLGENKVGEKKKLKDAKKDDIFSLMCDIWSYKGAENDVATAKALEDMVKNTLGCVDTTRGKSKHLDEGGLEKRLRAILTIINAIQKELALRGLSDITPELDPTIKELRIVPQINFAFDLSYRYFDPLDVLRFKAALYFSLKMISNKSSDVQDSFMDPSYWEQLKSYIGVSSADLTEGKKELMQELLKTCNKGLSSRKHREQRIRQTKTCIENFLSKNKELCQSQSYTTYIPVVWGGWLTGWGVQPSLTPSEGEFATLLQEVLERLANMKKAWKKLSAEEQQAILLETSQKSIEFPEQKKEVCQDIEVASEKPPSSERSINKAVLAPVLSQEGVFKLSKTQQKKARKQQDSQPALSIQPN